MKFLKDNALLLSLVVAVITAGGSLMVVSQKVYDKQRHVRSLDQQILTSQWDIRALRAELAFLTRPDRLDQITAAVSQADPLTDGRDGFAPVTFVYDDLPPSMSLLPPSKPQGTIYHKASVPQSAQPKREPTKAHQPQTVKKTPQPSEPSKPSQGFSVLLDKLGDGQ